MVELLFNLRKTRLCMLLACLLMAGMASGQVTPPNADTDAECGADCWGLFSWSRVQDGSGTNIPNFGEGIANDANCNTTIDASVEYVGNDLTPDLVGTAIGAGTQGNTLWVDTWNLGFGEALTDPILNITSLFTTSEVTISDCEGNPISVTDISTGTVIASGAFSGNDEVQLDGTFDCVVLTVSNSRNDTYTFSAGTCLGSAPLPACVACGTSEDFEYINLVNKTGSGTGATANIELDNILVGNAEVLFSDLDINEDLSGTTFGGFDNDGGTHLLKLEFCEPISIKQFEIKNLEVESQVSIGTTISGSGATATLGGVTLTQCAGSTRMSLNDGAPNLVITDGPGCGANPNASYTVGDIMTDVLYFKYNNPDGGCSFDYVGFKIGTCVSDGTDAVPVCPLTYLTYATDIEDYVDNGPDFLGADANVFQVMRDANGNYFNQNCTQIQNEVENGIAIPTVAISPCAEVVEEEDCTFCDPPAPCVDCPMGSESEFISLDKTGETMAGLDMGLVEIDGICVGSYEFLFSDLDVNTDGNGTQFGGFDNDGGTMLLQIDFCDPLVVNQLDVRNLEVMSQVSVGTTITGTGAAAVLGGQELTFCAGSDRMDADDITNGNLITTAGPGCGANPNASYTFGTNPVSTLYFKYFNPDMGCSYDYVGFKISTCVTPPAMEVPVCPLEVVRVTCDMDAVIANNGTATNANSDEYVVDGNGNYFDFQNCSATELTEALANGTPVQTVNIGCAELVETSEECVIADCVITPTCMATTCPDGSSIEYISLDETGNNMAGLPEGNVSLDGVQVGSYEFLFSDLDVTEDGRGTTFGGWDNDGGTMLLKLDLCSAIDIKELEIRNLEVGSQVSIGTSASTEDAAAVLSGMDLSFCGGSDRMTLNDGASNLVITDGPGCGANPNGTYTVSNPSATTIYFKYHNPPADGTFPARCRGDYVGFRIAACVAPAPEAVPECTLELYTVVTNDPDNPVDLYRDANGLYFESSVCSDPLGTIAVQSVKVSTCTAPVFVSICENCFIVPVLGDITCSTESPVITRPFTLTATGLENMKGDDNNKDIDFELNAYLYPEGTTAADFAYPPANAISIADAAAMTSQPTVPVFLGMFDLTNNCTEGSLTVQLPSDFPQGAYTKVVTLNEWPTGEDPADQPSVAITGIEVIPTMGQWALFILALLMSSLAVARMRQTKNHEVKELA